VYISERIKRVDRFYGKIGLTIGNFEGHHRGHTEILGSLVNESRKRGLYTAAITFKEHPLKILRSADPEKLWTPCEKIYSFKKAGIDLLLYIDFTKNFSSKEPKDFLHELDVTLKPKLYCLGRGFRFGKDNLGDVKFIMQLSGAFQFDLIPVDDVLFQDAAVSSTRIRKAVKSGNIELAGELLGRKYSVHLVGSSEDPFTLEPFISNYALPFEGLYSGKLVCLNTNESSVENMEIGGNCFQSVNRMKFRAGYLYKYHFFSNISNKHG